MKLLHFADLHLDRAFGGAAFVGCDSGRRRALLRQALQWAVDEALARQVDMVTIGGDLFEVEHVTSDTVAFVVRELSRLECPVLIAAGNHDFASLASPYRTHRWPDNVVLALEPRPVRVEMADTVVWSLGYPGREIDPDVLRGFHVPEDDRTQILVVHGVDLDSLGERLDWGGLALRATDVTAAGFKHALLGHIHAGKVGEVMSWPGSPVPLDPSETSGNHGALLVTTKPEGVEVEVLPASSPVFFEITPDIGAISDSSQLAAKMREALGAVPDASRALVTFELTGRRRPGLAVDPAELAGSIADAVLGVRVVDASVPEVDMAELASEPNARGTALSRLLEDGSPEAMLAARLMVDAFESDLRVPV